MSIDVAIPGERNVIKKEAVKISEYKDLITEIHGMWNVKTKVILVITGRLKPFQITRTVPEQHTGKARN